MKMKKIAFVSIAIICACATLILLVNNTKVNASEEKPRQDINAGYFTEFQDEYGVIYTIPDTGTCTNPAATKIVVPTNDHFVTIIPNEGKIYLSDSEGTKTGEYVPVEGKAEAIEFLGATKERMSFVLVRTEYGDLDVKILSPEQLNSLEIEIPFSSNYKSGPENLTK